MLNENKINIKELIEILKTCGNYQVHFFSRKVIIKEKNNNNFYIVWKTNLFENLEYHFMDLESFENLIKILNTSNGLKPNITDDKVIFNFDGYKVEIPVVFDFDDDFDEINTDEVFAEVRIDKNLIDKLTTVYNFYKEEKNLKELVFIVRNENLFLKITSIRQYESLYIPLQRNVNSKTNFAMHLNAKYLEIFTRFLEKSKNLYFVTGYTILENENVNFIFPSLLNLNFGENFVEILKLKDKSQRLKFLNISKYHSLILNEKPVFYLTNSRVVFDNKIENKNYERYNVSLLNVVKDYFSDIYLYKDENERKIYIFGLNEDFFVLSTTKIEK